MDPLEHSNIIHYLKSGNIPFNYNYNYSVIVINYQLHDCN